jgi:hypothetical protein
MHDWLRLLHGSNPPFPAREIAIKVALTLALGLLVGFEREWSNKDTGTRTFAMTALLGLLGSLLGPNLLLLGGAAVLILIVFANLRSLQVGKKLEATTSVSLLLIFMVGVLVGQGHLFTPVACSILVAMFFRNVLILAIFCSQCHSHSRDPIARHGRCCGLLDLSQSQYGGAAG